MCSLAFDTNITPLSSPKIDRKTRLWAGGLAGILALVFPLLVSAAPSTWSEAYFRGTANNWGASPMVFDEAAGVWSTRQTFGSDNPRFKISHFNNWNEAYPAGDVIITEGPGDYKITFNDVSKAIISTKVVNSSAPISGNLLCFDNPASFTQPRVYFWNSTPASSLGANPTWPGEPMVQVEYDAGVFHCFDLTANLSGAVLPQTMNVIFNDAGQNKTADLFAQNGFCYQNNTWKSLQACGVETIPVEPVLIAEAGENQEVVTGSQLTLSALTSQGSFTSAQWESDAWAGVLTGAELNTPALNVAGVFTVTLTLTGANNITASDTFNLTVTEALASNGETKICFNNSQNYVQPRIYFWAETPAGTIDGLPGWPGYAMSQAGMYFCYDFADHLTVANTMPTTLNVIFNDNGANQTEDLVFDGDACYQGEAWVGLADCGLGSVEPLFAEAGEDRTNVEGSNTVLSASGSAGNYTSAVWQSSAWAGDVTGSPAVTPTLDIVGEHIVTLTLNNGSQTAQDTFVLTVAPLNTGHGLTERPLLAQSLAFPISGNVSAGDYRFEKAFPDLDGQFMSPVMILPDGINDLIFVVDKPGSIFVFPNRSTVVSAEVHELLNIQATVRNYHEQGLLSMAFDPNYAINGFIYIYYIEGDDDNEKAADGTYGDAILERWTVNDPLNPTAVVQNSAVEVLRVPQPGPDHKGGMMQFHAEEGYLYLSIGDGAYGHSAITPFPEVDGRTNNSAQDTSNLRGSIIRIQPLEYPVNNKYYAVPNDNPFVGSNNFQPEIYSYGHRNPWRWVFDTEAPYTLWQTEVGQAGFEEVNLIQKGKNYGWPVCEGLTNRGELGGDASKNCSADFEPPREGYFQPEGFSIIGGVVYRGNKLPNLTGRFIFGDYVTKKIWSLVDGEQKSLVSDAFPENIVSFGTDLSGEELFVSTYGVEYGGNSTIYKVVDDDAETAVIPLKLSSTGLFSDLETLTPVSGVIEYDINTRGWFDGALIRHFVSIPNDTAISFDATGNWDLPIGSVVVKHAGVLATGNLEKPFTTSVLFRQESGNWQAANYYWNDAGTDATLVTETVSVSDGGVEPRTRAVQASADCGSCHTGSGSKNPLSLHTRQWNKNFDYPGGGDNQLDAFNYVGLFDEIIGDAIDYDAFAAPTEQSQSTNKRARSYLATNCAHCHSSSFMDLRFDTKLSDTRLIDTTNTSNRARVKPYQPENSLVYIYQTSDGNRMPKGSRHTNPEAQTLMAQWINAIDAQQVGILLTNSQTRFAVGEVINVEVKALFDNDFPVVNTNAVTWTSTNESVLNVDGLQGNTLTLSLNTVGETTLTAHSGGFSTSLPIVVTDSDTSITSLEIAPANVALSDSQQLVAFGVRADNSRANLFGELTWEVVSGGGAVSVSSTGLLTRISEGDAVVKVSYAELTQTLNVTQGQQDFVLQYDNSNSNWGQVYVYLWTVMNGQVTAMSAWPGVPMLGPDEGGIWRYTVNPSVLLNGKVNVIFNNNNNGQKTADQIDVAESSTYNQGNWTAIGQPTALSRLAVIAGSTDAGGVDFAVGSVVSVTANSAPLGTQFSGWSGDGVAYIVGDPMLSSVQVLMPNHGISLQAKFAADATDYARARDQFSGHCASCHGANGSGGVALAIDQLHNSNRYTVETLASYISEFMPADNTGACTGLASGECAFDIASLILNNQWQACTGVECDGTSLDTRNLRLLTKVEYLNSVRDIFAINFSDTIMSPVPADGNFRNFSTASTLISDNDRTLGFEMVAAVVAQTAIDTVGFNGLAPECNNNQCVVQTLGRKIFRRPLTGAEVQRYLALYSATDQGLTTVQGLLMSPHFMYRSEMGVLNNVTGLYELTDFEIASLLSYTFWVTTPDEILLSAAQEGSLNIEAQALRLVADPRSEQGLRRFASGWLINNQYPFPAISSPTLVSAFKEETVRFVVEAIRSNAPFASLLTANFTYANSELANHYGLTAGGDWSQVFFASDDERSGSGLLGQGSFLASRASTINPAPIKRGVYVREAIMCQEFPPPAAANFEISFEPSDSNRDATSRHTSDPACATCHQYIDGVGFGFERFDSSALYRVMETLGNGEMQEVDASGSIKSLDSPETVLDPDSTSYPYFSVPELASLIAQSGQGEACFSRQFYRYSVGKNEENAGDELFIRSYSDGLRNGGGMLDMLINLTTSDAFGVRR